MAVIVVGVDESRDARSALRWAVDEARLRDATLLVVHAYVRPLAYVGTNADMAEFDPQLHEHAAEVLGHLLDEAASDITDVDVQRRLHSGQAGDGLVKAAASAELLVVGKRGAGGFEGLLLGATAEHCARHAPCPVAVVPTRNAAERRRRLVVGVDGSDHAKQALAWAVGEATLRRAAIDVISVYQPYRQHGPYGAAYMNIASPGWERRFRQRAAAVAAQAVEAASPSPRLVIEQHVAAGHPAQELIQRSKSADVVVVGSRGHSRLAGLLLGSVSHQLLHHAACPVVVVRQ